MHYSPDRILSQFRWARSPVTRPKGFTLTELLVVLIIGSVIVTTLLSLVNELLKTNQRETAKTETQRDMQMALDYIAADLREAAYVYDPTCHSVTTTKESCPSYREYIPASIHTGVPPEQDGQTSSGSLAVLAFWKVDPLSSEELRPIEAPNYCSNTYAAGAGADTDKLKECDQIKRQKRTLTLVVYAQQWDQKDDSTSKWKGRSRIVRYELKKYKTLATLTRNKGYIDPLTDAGQAIFQTWPYKPGVATNCQDAAGKAACGLKNVVSGRPEGTATVLSDFLDEVRPKADRDLPNPICPAGAYSMGPRSSDVLANTATSAANNNPNNLASKSFFVCIRGQLDGTNIKQPALGEIQDIVVFLRGNAYGRARFLQDAYLPTIQTTIALRGIIDKTPK
jgi:prepilin-type N-terminal cleavage/methylation domain-containing protein